MSVPLYWDTLYMPIYTLHTSLAILRGSNDFASRVRYYTFSTTTLSSHPAQNIHLIKKESSNRLMNGFINAVDIID